MTIEVVEPEATAQLLAFMAAGLTDSAIARKLGVSERTVRRRVSEILAGLGVSTRFQAGLALAETLVGKPTE